MSENAYKSRAPQASEAPAPQLLTNMVAVGRVTPTSVRLWARLDAPTPLRLELHTAGEAGRVSRCTPELGEGGTLAFSFPDDFPGEAPLAPGSSYRFRLLSDADALIGEGCFKTPPANAADAPARWSLAFMSCHQPFDKEGAISQSALDMLSAAEKFLNARDVELVLFLGDQVYADAPSCLSLFSEVEGKAAIHTLSPPQMRARYHELYRRSWHLPVWQRLHARSATACLPDDHEVIDNWGSDKRHASPEWQELGNAALDVAFSWQGLRTFSRSRREAGSFQHSFRWGNAGIFLLDVRSHRQEAETAEQSQIVGADQLAALESFLQESSDLPVLFFGVPVPMVHLPDWLTSLGHALSVRANDLEDRWSNPCWVDTRDQILRRLEEHRQTHPGQRLVVLSGDIHAGWAVHLVDPKAPPVDDEAKAPGPPILQFVSSAVTNGDSWIVGTLSEALLHTSKVLSSSIVGLKVDHIKGIEGYTGNPFGGLNVGIVDIERSPKGEATVRFQLISHGKDEASAEPVVVFDSGPL